MDLVKVAIACVLLLAAACSGDDEVLPSDAVVDSAPPDAATTCTADAPERVCPEACETFTSDEEACCRAIGGSTAPCAICEREGGSFRWRVTHFDCPLGVRTDAAPDATLDASTDAAP